MTDPVETGATALLASGLDEFNPRHTSMATARDVARIVLSAMSESLLAAQREAIAEALYEQSKGLIHRRRAEEAADAVLGLVGAWLVGAVQAERERARAPESIEAACIAFVGEPWRKWSDGQKAACRQRMGYAMDPVSLRCPHCGEHPDFCQWSDEDDRRRRPTDCALAVVSRDTRSSSE